MTDNDFMKESEVEKQLKWLIFNFPKVENPKDDTDKMCNCINLYCQNALALLRHKIELLAQIQFVLSGVMHHVDKWLEGDELERNEVVRAQTMREKTLQIVEQQNAEIEKLTDDNFALTNDRDFMKSEAIKTFAEKLISEIVNRPSNIQSTTTEYLNGSAQRQNEILDLVKEMTEG